MPSVNQVPISISIILSTILVPGANLYGAPDQSYKLEEVIVTAQKREQSLQETPLAISVLNEHQLQAQGIYSLDGLSNGTIPSLRVQPFTNSPSTLIVAIRGNGPADAGPVTREPNVAVYLDGIYMGRPQGLSMEIAELERIEVLRGPQGTLFGRNATSGAVSLITKKPAGEFSFLQTLGIGNFDARRAVTRLDTPSVAGISMKLDYIHSQRDGWVKNSAPNEWDYNGYEKDGGRIALRFNPGARLLVDYAYDWAKVEASQNYFQFYTDSLNLFGPERDRRTKTRLPVTPLDPTTSEPDGHTLVASYDATETLVIKSLTGYRQIDEKTRGNYGPTLYYNGLVFASDINQRQFSQEFQFIGTSKNWEWVAGLYYFEEDVHQEDQSYFSLDMFGLLNGIPMSPIIPPTTRDLNTGQIVPRIIVDGDAQTTAAFGQATWSPEFADGRLHVTLGARYTDDEKSGTKTVLGAVQRFKLDTGNTDGTVSVQYNWLENFSSYAKWATGYQAGGVNPRSPSFASYDEVTVDAFEIGIKSELWDRRVRINADIFRTEIDNLPMDIADPANITINETVNNRETVTVEGLEADITVAPMAGLLVSLSYTYLDGDLKPTPNPLAGGALEQFELTQTPRHAGALSIDYTWAPWRIGTLNGHVDITSTDSYAYVPTDRERFDAYTLINARFTLSDIPLPQGELQLELWGKNLTDEEYIVNAFPVGNPVMSVIQAFGDPRTYGIDLTFKFQ